MLRPVGICRLSEVRWTRPVSIRAGSVRTLTGLPASLLGCGSRWCGCQVRLRRPLRTGFDVLSVEDARRRVGVGFITLSTPIVAKPEAEQHHRQRDRQSVPGVELVDQDEHADPDQGLEYGRGEVAVNIDSNFGWK